MKVDNFRTREFRDLVYHIAKTKGYTADKYNKVEFNFNNSGEIKPLTINKVKDDYVAYFKTERRDNQGYLYRDYVGITYNEVLSFKRDIVISEVVDGTKVEIADSRRVRPSNPAEFEPKVDMIITASTYSRYMRGKIVKTTAKTFQYVLVNNPSVVFTARLKKSGSWYDGSTYLSNDKKYTDKYIAELNRQADEDMYYR